MTNPATQRILDLILAECSYWHGRDEVRRGGYAILYAKAKEVADKSAPQAEPVACACGDQYPAHSYGAGFIVGSGMCENCDAAIPAKDIAQPAPDAEWVTCQCPGLYCAKANDQPDAELIELLAMLRNMVCATPENDKNRAGVWISTRHPTIQRIDAKLVSLR